MASKFLSATTITIFSFYFLLPLFAFQLAFAHYASTTPIPPEIICASTQYPSYCRNLLPKQQARFHDYGRFSVQKSLLQSRKFFNTVNYYLHDLSTLSKGTIRALEDCLFLSELSTEYLSRSNYVALKNTNESLYSSEADDTQTLLSAVITNHQTCLEGLRTTASDLSIKNGLFGQISDDNKLHSVSLALFTKGWVYENTDKTIGDSSAWAWHHPGFRKGPLSLKMTNRTRVIYDSARGRGKQEDDNADAGVLISNMVVVSKDGRGNFTTINEAVDSAPNNTNATDGYFLILILEGVYEEYVSIPQSKAYLMMIGEGIDRTVITGNHSVGDGWTTFNSPTFAVVAPGFVAINITFRNTAGPSKFQAVALRSGADMSTFYRCSFQGYQDTLYTHSMRQFYRECDINGTIDFIFGNAAVVLQNCNIYPRLPLPGQFNPITAQGRTDPNQNTGISIHNCTIKPADDLSSNVGDVKTYLGRPWKEYSRTVVMQSYLDSVIDQSGWSIWSGDFALSTLYYAEYGNRGPGADTSNRVTWPGFHVINAIDADNFTVANFLQMNAWLPHTGIPYIGGMIAINNGKE